MSQDPGLLKKLLESIQDFVLRFLNWFARHDDRGPDPEARIDLPTKIIYGEKISACCLFEAPKNTKPSADAGQPIYHTALQTQPLHAPFTGKKQESGNVSSNGTRTSGFWAELSRASVEYPKTPPDYSRFHTFPPTIRIEDWSSLPSPEVQRLTNLTVITTSSQDSLTIPREHFPGVYNGRRNVKVNRTTLVTGVRNRGSMSRSEDITGQHRRRRSNTRDGPATPYPLSGVFPSTSYYSILTRHKRTSKPLFSSSAIDCLEVNPFSTNTGGKIRQVEIPNSPMDATTRFSKREPLLGAHRRMTGREPQHRQRTSSLQYTAKKHHSQPLSSTAKVPFWNAIGGNRTQPNETCSALISKGTNCFRHSFNGVALPFPIVPVSSDTETVGSSQPHKRGLVSTSEKSPDQSQCPVAYMPLRNGQASDSKSTCSSDAPYPEVFSLDEYFEGFSSPVLQSVAPPAPLSRGESRDSSMGGVGQSLIHAFPSAHITQDIANMTLEETQDSCVTSQTAVPTWKPTPWSSDTDDDEQSLSRSEYSDETCPQNVNPSSSADTPLAELIIRRLGAQDRPDMHMRKRAGIIIGSTTSSESSLTINNERTSAPSEPMRQTKSVSPTPREKSEMDRLRAILRSRYAFSRLQISDSYSDLDIHGGDKEDSLLSLVESYSSGSTSLYHFHPRRRRPKSLPGLLNLERSLGFVVNVWSGTESTSDTSTLRAVPSEFNVKDGDTIAIDRMSPTRPSPNFMKSNPRAMVGLAGSRSDISCRSQRSTAGVKIYYQGTAPTEASELGPDASLTVEMSNTAMQRKPASSVSRTGATAAAIRVSRPDDRHIPSTVGASTKLAPEMF